MAAHSFDRPQICSFRNKSPAAIARELFKPSTDSTSLLVSITKKLFDLRLWFSLGDVTKRACF